MQTSKILATLVVAAGLMLAGCASVSKPVDSLNDTGWILVSLNGQPVVADTQVTINFAINEIHGSDGCNSYGTAYTSDGEKISIDKNMVGTLMACPDAVMRQSAAYAAALMQSAAYRMDSQQLLLLDANGKTLAVFAKQSTELGGTAWVVTGYNNGQQAVVSALTGSELTAGFSTDGRLSGSAGCNTYTASYKISGAGIQIGPAASTRKMCTSPAGVMEQETQFLKALETAAAYRLDGSQLELRTADGVLAVTLVKAGAAPAAATSASIAQALPNAEYPIELTATGKALLKDGLFEEPAAPGSAAKLSIRLDSEQAFGDLNGDGTGDAAVILVADPGGSGTFSYLALVINDAGTAKPAASVLLGDRIVVKSLAVQPGRIVVTMLTRKPEEPMSAEPTLEVTRTFQWQGGQLVAAQ